MVLQETRKSQHFHGLILHFLSILDQHVSLTSSLVLLTSSIHNIGGVPKPVCLSTVNAKLEGIETKAQA